MKRRGSNPASGQTWNPVKGVTITHRGHLQFQARGRRTGYPAQTKTFETKAEAEAWGISALDRLNRGAVPDRRARKGVTLREVIDRYCEVGIQGLKSAPQAISQARQIQQTSLADYHINNIGTAEVLQWLAQRRSSTVRRIMRDESGCPVKARRGRRIVVSYVEQPIGPKTVLNELMRLSAVFEFARVELKMVGLVNPVEDIPASKRPKPEPRTRRITPADTAAIIAACRASRSKGLGDIVELALETACRRSEIVTLLRWENIDLEARTATLRGTKSHDGSFRMRTIALSERAVEILTFLGPAISGRVFEVRPDNVTRNFRKACERAGVPNVTLHDHRGEAASRMAQDSGLDIVELAHQGGWKSLQMLKKYYLPAAKTIAAKLAARPTSLAATYESETRS